MIQKPGLVPSVKIPRNTTSAVVKMLKEARAAYPDATLTVLQLVYGVDLYAVCESEFLRNLKTHWPERPDRG